jgi:hypothetical protein
MRKLDQYNYETWALDFIEGKLDQAELDQFKAFLLLHPHIAEELEALQDEPLEVTMDSKESIGRKEELKTKLPDHLAQQSWDDLMISVLENDVSGNERQLLLKEFESSQGLKRDWALYEATKLKPEEDAFVFQKNALYRKEGAKVFSIHRSFLYRAAAVLLILGIGLQFILQENQRYKVKETNGFDLAAEFPLISINPGFSDERKISNAFMPSDSLNSLVRISNEVIVASNTTRRIKSFSDKVNAQGLVSIQHDVPDQDLIVMSSPLVDFQEPGIALASTENQKKKSSEEQYFDLNHPFRSVASWVKRQGNKRLELPEGQEVVVPGSVAYASAGAALLERLTGTTFALEPKFNKEGKMNDLSFRAGNYQLMLK